MVRGVVLRATAAHTANNADGSFGTVVVEGESKMDSILGRESKTRRNPLNSDCAASPIVPFKSSSRIAPGGVASSICEANDHVRGEGNACSSPEYL